MALTVTEVARTVFGNKRVLLADVAFDSSYPAGGEALSAADLGFSSIDAVFESVASDLATPDILAVRYDRANGLLLAFLEDFTEVTDTTDLSAYTVTLQVIGV